MNRISFIAVVACLLTLACNSSQFYEYPESAPTSTVDPQPSPSAELFRTIPFVPTATPSPTALPADTTPTPIPSTSINTPEGKLRLAFANIIWKDAVSVQSLVHWPATARTMGSEGQAEGVVVTVEGEYELVEFNTVDSSPQSALLDSFPEFHLRFSQEQADSETRMAGEIECRKGWVASDTTGSGLQLYASWNESQREAVNARKTPGIALFISVALTGGRIAEYDMYNWMTFERGKVVQTQELGLYGSGFSVYEATRVNKNGDTEMWKVWIDSDARPNRIELTIESDDPARGVSSAELEIEYTGKDIKPEAIPLELQDTGG